MPLKNLIFTFLFLNVLFLQSSYSQNYTAIDSIVMKYPDFGSTEKLAERIQKDFTSEHDKARAIYSWVAMNINYDLETYLDPPAPKTYSTKNPVELAKEIETTNSKVAQKTFRSQKAVCEGYALLYMHLSSLVGLKCQVVRGDSKTLLNDIGKKRLGINHAWNTVRIDGNWILVDATWGSGYFDEKKRVIRKEFTSLYFDQAPNYFYATHFPEASMYAGNTGNKDAFLNGPLIREGLIKENSEIIEPFSGIISANDGDKITFKIKNLSKVEDLYYLGKKDEKMKLENVKEVNGVLEFQITYNRKLGRFIDLNLFGRGFAAFKIVPIAK